MINQSTANTPLFTFDAPTTLDLKSTKHLSEISSEFLSLNSNDIKQRQANSIIDQLRKGKRDQLIKIKRGIKPISYEQPRETIPELIQGIQSTDEREVLKCITLIRKLLSTEDFNTADLFHKAGGIPHVVRLLSCHLNWNVIYEAVWSITNLAAGSGLFFSELISLGTIPILFKFLDSSNDKLVHQALWALANIAGDTEEIRDEVIAHLPWDKLVALLESTSNSDIVKDGIWMISNLCRGFPQPSSSFIALIIPVISVFMSNPNQNPENISNCCWALCRIAQDGEEKVKLLAQNRMIPLIINMLACTQHCILLPALRTIGNMICVNDLYTQEVLNCGLLQYLAILSTSPKLGIRKDVCWALSNITAGNYTQIEQVLNSELYVFLLKCIKEDEIEVAREAIWAVCNATTLCTFIQLFKIVELNTIEILCFKFATCDNKMQLVIMDGFENILKKFKLQSPLKQSIAEKKLIENGGFNELQSLQMSTNRQISKRAIQLLESYFNAYVSDTMDQSS